MKTVGIGKGNFSIKDVFTEAYKFAYQRRSYKDKNGHDVNLILCENAEMIRDYLKHSSHLHYDITSAQVKRVLFHEQVIVSAGALSYSEAAAQAAAERQNDQLWQFIPRSLAVSVADHKILRKEIEDRARGTFKQPSLHDIIDQRKDKPEQDETTDVYLRFPDDPNIRQYVRLNIKQNYVDASKPGQSIHDVNINFNDRNARRESYVRSRNEPAPPFYQDALSLYDVSHPVLRPCLEHLYNHVVKEDPQYFKKLQATLCGGQQLWLLSVPHNNAHRSSNLFSCVTDRSALLGAFAAAVERQPQVFLLFLSLSFMATNVRNQIASHVDFDPLPNLLLKEPDKRNTITADSLITVGKVSAAHLRAEQSFQDWDDYELRTAAGAIYEATWAHTDERTLYNGTSVLLPATKTYDAKENVYKVYAGAMTLSMQSRRNPALQKGNRLKVYIDSDSQTAESYWSGTVWNRFKWAGLDTVCFYTRRPYIEDEFSDLRSLHYIDPVDIDKWTLTELQNHVTKVKTNKITVSLTTDDKELKRRLKSILQMRVTPSMPFRDPERAESLSNSQRMFYAKNPRASPPVVSTTSWNPTRRPSTTSLVTCSQIKRQSSGTFLTAA